MHKLQLKGEKANQGPEFASGVKEVSAYPTSWPTESSICLRHSQSEVSHGWEGKQEERPSQLGTFLNLPL